MFMVGIWRENEIMFYIFLTVHLGTIRVNKQIDAPF